MRQELDPLRLLEVGNGVDRRSGLGGGSGAVTRLHSGRLGPARQPSTGTAVVALDGGNFAYPGIFQNAAATTAGVE